MLGGFLLANWFFTPPYYGLDIADVENLLALVVYVVAAGIVAVLVDRVGRSRLRAARLQAEAEALAALAGSLARPGSVGEMLGQLRTTFGVRAAALFRRDGDGWHVLVSSGASTAPVDPDARRRQPGARTRRDPGPRRRRALGATTSACSTRSPPRSRRPPSASGCRRRRPRPPTWPPPTRCGRSLLQAVSHDLRTPLASIKASISSLRQRDIDWAPEDVEEFQRTIEEETDRLTDLVGNLLDMSRLQAVGADRRAAARRTSRRSCSPPSPASAPAGAPVAIDVPETLPTVSADARAAGAGAGQPRRQRRAPRLRRWRRRGSPPARSSHDGRGRVDIRVIDRGPGIRPIDRELVFQPFQRVVDHRADGSGVGLGLAIARGFVEAMGGELTIDDTPGGGVTMVVGLPLARTERRP